MPSNAADAVDAKPVAPDAVGTDAVLELRGLVTQFPGDEGPYNIVDGISIAVAPGETLAVVGESGSGKTMSFLSAIGLVPRPGRVAAGEVLLDGVDLVRLSPEEMRKVRGERISMVFQDPLTGLNPVFTIGDQIAEVIGAHRSVSSAEARERAIALLERVHIPDPHRRVDDFPHQLSGGMRQRVLIAMAIALEPRVLIADEPTTALDVTVQAQILELLAELRAETQMSMVLITHDLGLVARYADHVAVMYAGRVVESGSTSEVYQSTAHPYTASLFASVPSLDSDVANDLAEIDGQPPDLAHLPPGCPFEARCFLGHGQEDCRSERPALRAVNGGSHLSACLHIEKLMERMNPVREATPDETRRHA